MYYGGVADPTYEFKEIVWIWQSDGPGAWHFVTLPSDLGQDIKEMFSENSKGFGSLKVQANIGNTKWTTSIFPSKEANSYILPLKAEVRKKENISVDDKIKVELRLLID